MKEISAVTYKCMHMASNRLLKRRATASKYGEIMYLSWWRRSAAARGIVPRSRAHGAVLGNISVEEAAHVARNFLGQERRRPEMRKYAFYKNVQRSRAFSDWGHCAALLCVRPLCMSAPQAAARMTQRK